jgi:4-aminobutyrate aminotransferase/(S)-3-amino-2-methylpropionate transaminase
VACAAALEIFRTVDTLDLPARSVQIGRIFESVTRDWPRRFPLIGDIRGVGAMRAIELVRNRATKEPADIEAREVLAGCHHRGLVIISAGTFGNVIRLLVPLIATDAQIEEGLHVLAAALSEVPGTPLSPRVQQRTSQNPTGLAPCFETNG